MTISDAQQPDYPLVWANPAFAERMGYSLAEVLGRNCRFLQGPSTDPDRVARIRTALAEQQPVTVTLRNYRKDGTAFWNELSVSPVHNEQGRLVHFVGVQVDVSQRVRLEQERQAAYTLERQVRQQLVLLADVSAAMTTLDVDVSLQRSWEWSCPGWRTGDRWPCSLIHAPRDVSPPLTAMPPRRCS